MSVCVYAHAAFYIIAMLLFLAPYGYLGQPVLSLCFVNYNRLNEKCLVQIKSSWVVVITHNLLNT